MVVECSCYGRNLCFVEMSKHSSITICQEVRELFGTQQTVSKVVYPEVSHRSVSLMVNRKELDVRMNEEISNCFFKGNKIPIRVACAIPVRSYFILVVNNGSAKGRSRLKLFFT